MHPSEELRSWIIGIASSNAFRQIAPLVILILLPTLIFLLASNAKHSSFLTSTIMGLESLGAHLSWLWFPSTTSSSSSGSLGRSSTREKRKSKKHVRTRAEQFSVNGTAKHETEKTSEDDEYYSGLVNISGTYCFMNSTLQALASLSYLQPHIDDIHAKAEALDVPTPVIDAIQDLFRRLNRPRTTYHAIRPIEVIEVLSKQTEGRPNSLFYSREHQDAQELFQVLSECIKNETAAVDKESYRDRGLGGFSQTSETMREIGKSVFDGLTANRRSCVVCGYTEAVMHFAFDNWQLSVPRLTASCRLEDCLEDYTRLEILKDCICRKCSMLATHRRLLQEIRVLEEATRPEAKPSSSKKRRLKEVRKMEARVKAALSQGRIEDDLKDVRVEKVVSPASTKQAMIARPPPVLALHINRSVHYGQYASKNNVRIVFPEVLDLTPYTTSGNLSTVPTAAISTPPPVIPRSTTPTPATHATPRTIYRLAAVVCHYGGHSFGHYVCYRRKPKHPSVGKDRRYLPPKLLDPLRVGADGAEDEGSRPEYVWEDSGSTAGKGWLRISDDAVRECGIETVLSEGSGAFMLYYERATQDLPGIYPSMATSGASPRASEETLKPEMKTVELNGSVGSLISEVGVGVLSKPGKEEEKEKVESKLRKESVGLGGSQILGPRIVRSVAAGRGRSMSVQPSSSSEKRASSVASVSSTQQEASQQMTMSIAVPQLANGNAHHPLESSIVESMTASAPSILMLARKESSKRLNATESPSLVSISSKPPPPPPRIHSPQPHHPPASPSTVVGLKA